VSLLSGNASDTRDTRRIEISAEQSSQFASSLLLAAPLWENGLELHLTGNISSLPYIDMTINMMRQCGIDVSRDNRDITVKPGVYNIENIKVEPDWSAAAFWYEMVSLSDDAEVLLKNLNINSLQADAAAIKMFENLGVKTIATEEGAVIKKANGQQSMVNGQQSMVNGQWSTVNSQRSTVNGQRSTVLV
jgi:3-phosphoshikimate 1-carboxyvinyltransferase